MLETREIEDIKRTLGSLKEAENVVVSLEAEMNLVKKQATELFKKHSIKGFSELPVLEDKLAKMEEVVRTNNEEAIAYIEKVNKVKQETESILIG